MKKMLKALLEIIKAILILCWVLYSPIWACMIAYNAACYANYGEVATPNIVIIVATALFIVNVIWINRVDEKGGKRNG